MSSNTERAKSKINALLAKTVENGATEEEMNSALAKAAELMKIFFITEHDLKESIADEHCILAEEPLYRTTYIVNLFYYELAVLFDCKHFFNKERIAFYGFKQDTQLCVYFYRMIMQSCFKAKDVYRATQEFKAAKRQGYHAKTLVASFIKGYLLKVAAKLQDLYKDRQSNLEQSTGLMIIKEQLVQEQYDKEDFNVRVSNPRELYYMQQAFEQGVQAGEDFEIIQGVDASDLEEQLKLEEYEQDT